MRYTRFKRMKTIDNWKLFEENCVDFERGDEKPQIRIHGDPIFNVTNSLYIENVRFTAEDNLIRLNQSLTAFDELSIVMPYAPARLCEIQNKTEGYLETQIGVPLQPQSEVLNYTCETGFNATWDKPPYKVDDECTDELPVNSSP